MWGRRVTLTVVTAVALASAGTGGAVAAGSESVLRNQTRVVTGAIERQVKRAFYAAKRANVRAQPEAGAHVIGQYEPGAPVTVNSATPRSGWYEVRYQDQTGYVWASLIERR